MKKLLFTLPCTLALVASTVSGCSAGEPNASSAANEVNVTTTTTSSNQTTATDTANTLTTDTSTTDTISTPQGTAQPVAVKGKAVKTKPAKANKPAQPSSVLSGAPDTSYRVVPEGVAAARAFEVPPPPAAFKVADKVRVRLTTSKGPFVVELNAKEAPLHVKSFVYLARRGFFNGTIFHRWADLTGTGGNIIQGGDPQTKKAELSESYGQGGPGYQIPRERNALTHQKLVIAAARTQDPDSAGSQFYITQGPTEFLDQGDGYTVFGRVVSGDKAALALREKDKLQRVEVIK